MIDYPAPCPFITNCHHPYMNLPTLLTLPNALGLFALVNLWTFMLFGFDKIRAEAGSWRVSEGALLAWAFLGGDHRRLCRPCAVPA